MAQTSASATSQSASTEAFEAHWARTRSRFRELWLPAILCTLLLGVEIYALIRDDGQGSRMAGARAGKVLATFVSGKKVVQDKASGTLVWEKPVDGQSFYREDSIATLAGSEAVVQFPDESQVRIEEGSLLVFEEA